MAFSTWNACKGLLYAGVAIKYHVVGSCACQHAKSPTFTHMHTHVHTHAHTRRCMQLHSTFTGKRLSPLPCLTCAQSIFGKDDIPLSIIPVENYEQVLAYCEKEKLGDTEVRPAASQHWIPNQRVQRVQRAPLPRTRAPVGRKP